VPPYPIEMSILTKKLTILLLFTLLTGAAVAQGTTVVTEKKKGRPDIPGTFQLDLGFNFPSEKAGFNTSFFGSSTVNIYYFYDMRIGKSKFSIHPGIGFGLERYKFNNFKTLGYNATQDTVFMVPSQFSNLRKSKLITNYLDIPLEVRFSTRPDDPNRSFKISLGFKVGVLFDSYTKQKYSDDGEKKKVKDKQNFNLYPIRFGPYFRIGGGNLSVFAYYNMSPLFKNGGFGEKIGTQQSTPENINNFVIGVSLATF
jgi:Outer membrane protein beta-barrel domain